jgi:hypothetical protein
MIVKTCNKCKTEKPLTDYAKRETKSGYRTICKKCTYKKRTEIKRIYPNLIEYTCKTCKKTKPISEYNKNRNKPSGIVEECNDCRSVKSKKRYEENKEEIKQKVLNHYYENKSKIIESRRGYSSKRCKVDVKYKLTRRLRSRLYDALKAKSWKKTTKFYDYIGCSLDELKQHLESQFTDGMTWENYGKWHIDHIKPLVSANTEEEMYKLCHYSNLQPLWAVDNIKKGHKI